jgi:hypothetical protein
VRGRNLPVLDHLARSPGGGKAGLRAVASILSKAGPIYQGLIFGLEPGPGADLGRPAYGHRHLPVVAAHVLGAGARMACTGDLLFARPSPSPGARHASSSAAEKLRRVNGFTSPGHDFTVPASVWLAARVRSNGLSSIQHGPPD